MKNFLLYCLLVIISFTSSMANNPEFEIKLKSGNFVPAVSSDLSKAIEPLSQEIHDGHVYRLVQFYSIPTNEEKNRINDSGIELLSYIPNKAYIAKIRGIISNSRLNNLNIRTILTIDDNLKLSPLLTRSKLPEWAVEDDNIKLIIKTFSINDDLKLINQITGNNGSIIGRLDEINILFIACPIAKIKQLSKSPYIQWIEPISPQSTPDDTGSKSSTRSNALNTSYNGGRKYDGSGVVVALSDDGMIGPHIDFTGRVTHHTDISSGKHGDMTSGIFVGAGNLDPTIGGIAPGADIHIYKQGTSIFLNSYEHVVNGVSNLNTLGTVITSTSYSQGQGGIYNSTTEFTDKQINENQSLIHILSAGNSGTFDHGYGAGAGWGNISGGIKAGKNVICAGNVTQNDEIFITSSRGPAADGRIKPDLCAQGEGQMSTDENNNYQQGAGTSASTPAIAGIIAQLYQAYKEMNGGENPESALIKAALLNTAKDLGNPGPDYTHGWGRINGLKAARVLEDNRYIKDEISQGGTNTHNIVVPNNVSQLRVMTYWTDVEANPASSAALVNDINMELTLPDASTVSPWVLDPTPSATALNSPATNGVDFLNNVEQVTIENPLAGEYEVKLNGFSIPEGPQGYYVIYEFIFNDIEITYPLGGEGMVPGETETIRWDASASNEMFTLEYSTDNGVTYSTLSSNIPSHRRRYSWAVPNTLSNEVKLKLSRGGTTKESQNALTFVGLPENLNIVRVCPDTIELAWQGVNNVDLYEISMLGDKYMDSIGVSSNNTYYIVGLDPNDTHWFSVRSIINGSKGRRAIAVQQTSGTQNCILDNDIELVKINSPTKGVISDCRELVNSTVSIQLNNLGSKPAENVELSYQIDSKPIVTEIFAGPLMPGDWIDYQFSTMIDISNQSEYNISVSVADPNDQNIFNDKVDTSFEVISGSSTPIPHEQNFNSFSTCQTLWTTCNLDCKLSNGYVNLENGKWDDIDWRVRSGATPSYSFSDTGTSGDYDLNGDGSYLYLESISGCTFKEGKLLSPCIDLTNISCVQLEFAYHLFGSAMGDLHVDVITDNAIHEDIITPLTGNHGDVWKLAIADLSMFSGEIINVVIRGVTGSGSTSVMVIDAISLKTQLPDVNFHFEQLTGGTTVEFENISMGIIDTYVWDFGDDNTSNDSNPSHTYGSNGTYEVTLTVTGPCGSNSITQAVIVGSTSVLEIENLEKLVLIYPNPTQGLITLQIPLQLSDQSLKIEVHNVLGNLIWITNTVGKEKIDIDLTEFVEGVYFVNILSRDLRVKKKILILRN